MGFEYKKGRNNLIKGVYNAFMMRILFQISSYELFNEDGVHTFNVMSQLRVWLWKHL
mgnify:CR=1 FL=1